SRKGFSSSICSTSWASSSVVSCSRRIDCCSCGVSARCCETRSDRPSIMACNPLSGPASRRGLPSLSHAEVLAQVQPAHLRVVDDVRRRTLSHHLAVADDEGVVEDAQRLTHVMVGDQHANDERLEKANGELDLDQG